MKLRKNPAIFAALAFCLCGAPYAWAKDKECAGRSGLPIVKLLPPPPCGACEETKAEIDELLHLQNTRTEEERKHALADENRSVGRFFEGAGIAYDASKLEACEGFFKARRDDEKQAVNAIKTTFCRKRPYDADIGKSAKLRPLSHEDSFAYPSGHATYGSVIGLMLAEMLPEKRAEIYARIDDYGHSRMIAGVHHRSDIEAGKIIGAAIDASLFAREGFLTEFNAAKICIRDAVDLP